MADYIYLLATRLTTAQQTALERVREAARAHGMTVFLTGGAVRDLTSGSPIRDLDISVQGNALELKTDIEKLGGVPIGENDSTQTLYFNFPRGVRLEVGSTLSAVYPQPGEPVFHSASILEDLRRRDFTANAMAISLNEGSYGLLMDPLNGVADIENRELRLVSNYGFIEDPIRLIRAARFGARFGWHMEEKTQQRYETGKAEGYIKGIKPAQAGYELEEIFHEEDPLRVLRRLETEGWAKVLFPAWTSAKANEPELDRLRDTVGQLELMGIHPDPSPAYFPLLTAKLTPKEVAALKSSFARPGFADQIAALEADTRQFAAQFSSKAAAAPSDAWKMLFASAPEPVLWLAHTTKSAALQAKFKAFFNEWSQARQKIPYQLMQEMRITPDLPGYEELLDRLFFAIMDQKLETPEAAKAFLEPFSPPAPPPPINLRRRAVKRESKAAKPRPKKASEAEPLESAEGEGERDMAPPEAKPEPVEPAAVKPAPAKSEAARSAPAKAAPAEPAPAKAALGQPAAAAAGGKTPAKAPASAAKSSAAPAAKQPAKASKPAPAAKVAKQAGENAGAASAKPAAKPSAKAMPAKSASSGTSARSSHAAKKAPVKAVSVAPNKPLKKSAPAPAKGKKPAAPNRAKPSVKSSATQAGRSASRAKAGISSKGRGKA